MTDAPPPFAREPQRAVRLPVWTWAMRGGPPEPPIYLRTVRGTLYHVWRVRRCRPQAEARYVFSASQIGASDVPDGAKVIEWRWRR